MRISCLVPKMLSFFFLNCDGGHIKFRGQDDHQFEKIQFHWICHRKNSRIRYIMHLHGLFSSRVIKIKVFQNGDW